MLPTLGHMVQVLLLGGVFAIVTALIAFKVFDMMSDYKTWEEIQKTGSAGLFAGLLVLGVTLGAFLFAAHTLG